jgi:type 1 glutamine amidotransferase
MSSMIDSKGAIFFSGAAVWIFLCMQSVWSAPQAPLFRAIVLYSTAVDHVVMSTRAKALITQMGKDNNFSADFTSDTSSINEANLAKYQLFIELHFAPGLLNLQQRAAFQKFIGEGKGWVGIHGAGLIAPMFLGAGVGYWQWFETFFGGVEYVNHPAYQMGTLIVEDRTHPATKNLPAKFQMRDEWYEFNKSPRPSVRVLGKADESTYTQVKPSTDHPLVWTNENTPGRMIYIGVGHDSSACGNPNWVTLFHDAVMWAGTRPTAIRSNASVKEKLSLTVRLNNRLVFLGSTDGPFVNGVLVDVSGRVVAASVEKNHETCFDCSTLPVGMYVVLARGAKNDYSQKVVIGR